MTTKFSSSTGCTHQVAFFQGIYCTHFLTVTRTTSFDAYYSDGDEQGYGTEIEQCEIVSFLIVFAL